MSSTASGNFCNALPLRLGLMIVMVACVFARPGSGANVIVAKTSSAGRGSGANVNVANTSSDGRGSGANVTVANTSSDGSGGARLATSTSPSAAAVAADFLAADLGQAQGELQELIDKRTSWAALCAQHDRNSSEWRRCQDVVNSSQWEVDQKEEQVASYDKRLSLLTPGNSSRQRHGTSLISSGDGDGTAMVDDAASEAADTLSDDLSRAQFELEELSEKRERWAVLCASSPLIQRRPGLALRQEPQQDHEHHQLTASSPPQSAQCLNLLKNIDGDIARKTKETNSYQAAMKDLDAHRS